MYSQWKGSQLKNLLFEGKDLITELFEDRMNFNTKKDYLNEIWDVFGIYAKIGGITMGIQLVFLFNNLEWFDLTL